MLFRREPIMKCKLEWYGPHDKNTKLVTEDGRNVFDMFPVLGITIGKMDINTPEPTATLVLDIETHLGFPDWLETRVKLEDVEAMAKAHGYKLVPEQPMHPAHAAVLKEQDVLYADFKLWAEKCSPKDTAHMIHRKLGISRARAEMLKSALEIWQDSHREKTLRSAFQEILLAVADKALVPSEPQ
jgi:hypothetical protein